jgi:ATP-dependent helicase/nuclease subunit B
MGANRAVLGEFRDLESALWREIRALQAGDPLRRVTVVVPSTSLARHLKIQGARAFPQGLFAVRFVTFFQFAVGLLEHPRRFVGDAIFHERVLLGWLHGLDPATRGFPATDPCSYDFAGALAAAVRDLRDAGVPEDPEIVLESLRVAVEDPQTRLTAMDVRKFAIVLQACAHYGAALSRLGVLDRAGVFREAAAAVEARRGPTDPVLVYGFYDMIQVQADLVVELARRGSVTLFVPDGPDEPTWRFGGWFRDTFLPTIVALRERCPSVAAPPLAPAIHSAAGEGDEIWFCAKRIRRLLDDGCPPAEIAVVARTLDPYRDHVERSFREHRIPFTAIPTLPLLEHPLGQAIRSFFRLAPDGFPRAAVLEVVGHPAFRVSGTRRYWTMLVRGLRIGRGDDWGRLGRYVTSGYVLRRGGGRHDPQELRVPAAEVRGLDEAVRGLMDRRWPERGAWGVHAEAHRDALETAFGRDGLEDDEARVLETIHGVLRLLAAMERLGGVVSRAEFLDAFEHECARRMVETRAAHGVLVLDAMGVRGLAVRHVFVIGLNARVFPRFIVEEPFISDAVRREVFRRLGHHLAVRMDGYDEERLLFHLVRSAATERLVCVYQRADGKGRLRDPSPFVRPFLPLDRERIDAIPRSEVAKRARGELQTPREAILAAGDAERAAALAAFEHGGEQYARGRAYLHDLDERQEVGAFEGRTGAVADHWQRRSAAGFSATRLELFARCPFQYFAREVLRVLAVDEGPDDDLGAKEIGRLMHAILERLYRSDEDRDDGGTTEALDVTVRRIAAEVCGEFEVETGRPIRGVLAVRREQIIRCVVAYAHWDLAHLGDWSPVRFEESIEFEFAGLRMRATLDRVDRDRATGSFRVVEYKRRFSGHWETGLDTQAVRGRKLQAPLYLEAAAALARRDAADGGVGNQPGSVVEAAIHFVETFASEDASIETGRTRRHVRRLGAEEWDAVRERVAGVVACFAGLIHEGWFFIRPEDGQGGHCSWCDFATICRKGHGRLRDKPRQTPALEPYWDIVGGRGARA